MKDKTVFIYSNFDFSKKSAGATRMLYYAEALASVNISVYLVSCSKKKISKASFKEHNKNIYITQGEELTQGFFGTLYFLRSLLQYALKTSSNSVFIFYPSPLVYLELFSIFYLKLIKKCFLYYELNEIRKFSSTFHAPFSLKKPKYSLKKIIFKGIFNFMENLLPFYDGLICISTSINKYGTNFNKNTLRIPILTDPEKKHLFSNKVYAKPNSFNIGFSGSIKPSKENLNVFLTILSQLVKDGYDITFNLCGSISKNDYNEIFEKLIDVNELKNRLFYYGNLNEIELSTFLSQQNLLVIPRGYTLQNKYGFSTKLSDYLNHKKIILITDISDNKLFIIDGVNGFIIPPNNNHLMSEKIKYIINNFSDLEKFITNNAYNTSKEKFHFLNYNSEMESFLFN